MARHKHEVGNERQFWTMCVWTCCCHCPADPSAGDTVRGDSPSWSERSLRRADGGKEMEFNSGMFISSRREQRSVEQGKGPSSCPTEATSGGGISHHLHYGTDTHKDPWDASVKLQLTTMSSPPRWLCPLESARGLYLLKAQCAPHN